eukprot:CAMPEP_0204856504 /NCGR_PEP_ID=MMETSP1347-20130617/18627_1 /ASSEMBLY_ACC=CAM_ASM_000690 /TAXON_ID=215587 /ORGANISM="Aplanochytrium stocchinoi, Strain GSBS06" /LENGTH=34 /DNA_ID= /DNA_START= /DNA_END= /DNA_ORIENTATION=
MPTGKLVANLWHSHGTNLHFGEFEAFVVGRQHHL